MATILISACLLGHKVRYNAKAMHGAEDELALLGRHHQLLALCPEVAGGLPTPRPAAEIQTDAHGNNRRIQTAQGQDVTEAFVRGAERALAFCQQHGIRHAVLTEGSPSCGSQLIHDGHFAGRKVAGEGVTAALLRQHGIAVYNQHQLALLQKCLTEASGDEA